MRELASCGGIKRRAYIALRHQPLELQVRLKNLLGGGAVPVDRCDVARPSRSKLSRNKSGGIFADRHTSVSSSVCGSATIAGRGEAASLSPEGLGSDDGILVVAVVAHPGSVDRPRAANGADACGPCFAMGTLPMPEERDCGERQPRDSDKEIKHDRWLA